MEQENKFMQIGYVSSEGGPFWVGDYNLLIRWNGVETDDYETLIQTPEEDFCYGIGEQSVVAWDTEGCALVSVHQRENGDIVLIKSFEELSENDKYEECSGTDESIVGDIAMTSGRLLVLHATESGVLLEPLPSKTVTRLSGDLAFEDSVLAILVENGVYSCISDYVYDNGDPYYKAKRLIISKISQ